MVKLLIALSVVEVLLLVGVLAYALVQVTRRLRSVSSTLGRIAFGVRAIERHVATLDAGVTAVNGELELTAGTLVKAKKLAES